MGKKIRRRTDWSLDKGNEVGDVVMLAQHAQTSLGVVSFLGQAPAYNYHAQLAGRACEQARILHSKVLEIPVTSNSNVRFLSDENFLADIYMTGSELIVNTYLTFEHLALHVGITLFRQKHPELYKEFEEKDLQNKFKDVLKWLDLESLVKSKGYGVLFSDIEKVRHAINHPKGSNIYSIDASQWDRVPLAWFVSGKHLQAYSDTVELYRQVVDGWTAYTEANKATGTITLNGPLAFEGYTAPKKPKN